VPSHLPSGAVAGVQPAGPQVAQILAANISVQRGEVLVPTHIGLSGPGLLSCPAAPLVAGSLQRRGCQVRMEPVPHCESADEADADGALLYLATWPRSDGTTMAMAAATRPQEKRAAAFARSAVEEWAAVTGSRALLAGGSPWCSGAEHAATACRQAAADNAGSGRTVWLLGQPMLPPETARELAALGARQSPSLADAQEGDVVVFPAHGVPAEVRVEAAERGLTILDATCPVIARAQDTASRLADHDQHLVLIGPGSAAATVPIASRAAGHVTLLENAGGTITLRVSDARRLAYMVQPGMPVEAAAGVVEALRARYPAVSPPEPDALCYAASDRAATVRAIATGSDLVLVLGDGQAADARQLLAQVRECGAKAQPLGAVSDITPAMLADVVTVGLAESTSAPAGLAAQVIAVLGGLGRVSVGHREVSTEVAGNVR
jgi:4-hydroxy-3-methylbut-2-en-1-yl diphosphate reductase